MLHRRLLWTHRLSQPWETIVTDVQNSGSRIAGIDIFDTVLTRRVLGDEAAAIAVARRITDNNVWPGDVPTFLAARSEAARQDPDAPLIDWLRALELNGLTSADHAARLEAEVEAELLRPVPGAVEALARMRESHQIHFVSDMHLDSSTLRALLMRDGLATDADQITVSCEVGFSKSGGQLFAKVFDSDQLQNDAVVFIGNNHWADVTRAADAGAQVIPSTAANPSRYESAMASSAGSPGPVIASAARSYRLQGRLSEDSSDISHLAAQVIGQCIAGFLLWIREVCELENITHLDFLARDGELPLRMAQAMPDDHWSGFELDYLQCGRRAWSLAAAPLVGMQAWVDLGTADHSAFLLHSANVIPFASVLKRCGLTPADIPANHVLRDVDATSALGSVQDVEAYRSLLISGELHELIAQRAQGPLDLILRSLRQRNLPVQRIALVDVGWRGQQALLISAIIREATGHEPLHLHFGGSGVVKDIDDRVDIKRFALDDSIRSHPIAAPVSCLEMFLASGNARLMGYREVDEGLVEEVFEAEPSAVSGPDQRQLWHGAIRVASSMPSRALMGQWCDLSQSVGEEVRQVLQLFWNTPTRGEAETLSGLRFEGDDAGDSIDLFLRSYSMQELRGRAAVPRQWREGSLAVTPLPFRSVMRCYFALKRA